MLAPGLCCGCFWTADIFWVELLRDTVHGPADSPADSCVQAIDRGLGLRVRCRPVDPTAAVPNATGFYGY